MPPKRKIACISQSRPVKFIIGGDKVEYTVHEEAFASLSPTLRAMLSNGMMKESLEAKVIWDDVDPDTFEILAQFAYCGDYDESILRDDSEDFTAHANEKPALEKCDRTSPSGASGSVEPGLSLADYIGAMDPWADLHNGLCSFCMDRFTLVNLNYDYRRDRLWKEDFKSEGRQTYLEYFMKHVKVYLLADKYNLDGLATRSLQTIRRATFFSPITSELMDALVDIFSAVDENTLPEDRLRGLLIDYFICQMDWIKWNGYLHRLVDELGLAKELLMTIPQSLWDILKLVPERIPKD